MSPLPLNQLSGMPQMARAFAGWTKKITLTRRIQSVDGFGNVTYALQPFKFEGTIQPLSPRKIELKPEGQRSWTWLQIHVVNDGARLNDNDQIVFNGVIYKVMGLYDYSLNNFIEYHAVQEYQP